LGTERFTAFHYLLGDNHGKHTAPANLRIKGSTNLNKELPFLLIPQPTKGKPPGRGWNVTLMDLKGFQP